MKIPKDTADILKGIIDCITAENIGYANAQEYKTVLESHVNLIKAKNEQIAEDKNQIESMLSEYEAYSNLIKSLREEIDYSETTIKQLKETIAELKEPRNTNYGEQTTFFEIEGFAVGMLGINFFIKKNSTERYFASHMFMDFLKELYASHDKQPEPETDKSCCEHEKLFKFYQVDSINDLINMQKDHIKRLQDKLPKPSSYRHG